MKLSSKFTNFFVFFLSHSPLGRPSSERSEDLPFDVRAISHMCINGYLARPISSPRTERKVDSTPKDKEGKSTGKMCLKEGD